MKNEYDESVIEWFSLKNGNIMVKLKYKNVLTMRVCQRKSIDNHPISIIIAFENVNE